MGQELSKIEKSNCSYPSEWYNLSIRETIDEEYKKINETILMNMTGSCLSTSDRIVVTFLWALWKRSFKEDFESG